MKRTLIAIAVLSLFAGSMLASKAATQGNSNEKEKGTISVSTSSETEIAPDVAEISFGIKTTDTKSMQKASLMNKDISEKVYNTLKELINTSNGDFIKTSNYHASPVYIYKDKKQVLDKYEVSNRVTVHTKSLDKLGAMIDRSTEAGATNVDSLNFSVSNYESQCNSLIEAATKKANARANIAAKNSGSMLDGIKTMNISCSETKNYNAPRLMMAKSAAMGAANDSAEAVQPTTSVSAGVIKIYSNINAVFYVK